MAKERRFGAWVGFLKRPTIHDDEKRGYWVIIRFQGNNVQEGDAEICQGILLHTLWAPFYKETYWGHPQTHWVD